MGKFGIVAVLLVVVGAIAIYEASAANMRSVAGTASTGTASLPWCPAATSDDSFAPFLSFQASRDGKTVTGTMQLRVETTPHDFPPNFADVTGIIDDGNIADASRYRLTGFATGDPLDCFTNPVEAFSFTLSGTCSRMTDSGLTTEVISYTDELGGTGTFNGPVTCTFK